MPKYGGFQCLCRLLKLFFFFIALDVFYYKETYLNLVLIKIFQAVCFLQLVCLSKQYQLPEIWGIRVCSNFFFCLFCFHTGRRIRIQFNLLQKCFQSVSRSPNYPNFKSVTQIPCQTAGFCNRICVSENPSYEYNFSSYILPFRSQHYSSYNSKVYQIVSCQKQEIRIQEEICRALHKIGRFFSLKQ